MIRTIDAVFISLLASLSVATFGQTAEKDTTKSASIEKKRWLPLAITGLRLGTDITEPLRVLVASDALAYVLNTDIQINNKYFLTFDYGYYGFDRGSANLIYESSGSYFSLGC